MMLPQWVIDLPWEIFETLISFAELLIICIPATIAFTYYRIQSVKLHVVDVTNNGSTLLIHNKTNRSIFITDIQVITPTDCDLGNPTVSWNQTIFQLKPDDYLEVVINYTKHSQNKKIVQFLVRYDHRKTKRIKVKI